MELSSKKGKFTEQELEDAIIELLQKECYTHVHGQTIHRRYDEVLLEDDISSYLQTRYNSENLTANEIIKIINNIKLISPYPLYDILGDREYRKKLNMDLT